MRAAGLCQAGMPVPMQVVAASGRGPPAPPFRTEPGWHQLAQLFIAATEQSRPALSCWCATEAGSPQLYSQLQAPRNP